MIEKPENRKLVKELMDKVTEIVDIFRPYVDGILLVGSLAYGVNSVNCNSDIDFLIIADTLNLESICNSYLFSEIVPKGTNFTRLFAEGVDIYGLKEYYEGVVYNVHFMSLHTLESISTLSTPTVNIARKRHKTGQYTLKGVARGSEIYWPLVTIQTRTCPLTSIPVYIRGSDNFYIGNHPDKLLSNSQVLVDNSGNIVSSVEELYKAVAKEYIKYGGDLHNLPGVLVRRERFSDETVQRIREKVMKSLSK